MNSNTTLRSFPILVLSLAFFFFQCGSKNQADEKLFQTTNSATPQLVAQGKALFENRNLGEVDIACIDCHSEYDDYLDSDERIRAGHAILGAHKRVSTWNGQFQGNALRRTAAGAAKCASIYQLCADDIGAALSNEEAEALLAYFGAISTGNEPPRLVWSSVSYPGDPRYSKESVLNAIAPIEKLHGDGVKGEVLFRKTCMLCHGPGSRGIGPAIQVMKKHIDDLTRVVRTGYDNMPFFSRDKLSDQDIADIKAWVERTH